MESSALTSAVKRCQRIERTIQKGEAKASPGVPSVVCVCSLFQHSLNALAHRLFCGYYPGRRFGPSATVRLWYPYSRAVGTRSSESRWLLILKVLAMPGTSASVSACRLRRCVSPAIPWGVGLLTILIRERKKIDKTVDRGISIKTCMQNKLCSESFLSFSLSRYFALFPRTVVCILYRMNLTLHMHALLSERLLMP